MRTIAFPLTAVLVRGVLAAPAPVPDGPILDPVKDVLGRPIPDLDDFSKRQDSGNHTKVTIGETQIDWGCGTVPYDFVKDAVNDLCTGDKCDNGREWEHQITWTDGSFPNEKAKIVIAAQGTVGGEDTRNALRDAIWSSITKDTRDDKEIRWDSRAFHGTGGICKMARWANFAGATLYDSDDMPTWDLELSISVEGADSSGFCASVEVYESISSQLPVDLAQFLGPVSFVCEAIGG